MTNRKSQNPDLIATEAADWYARLRAPDVPELERVRFRAWLASDPARRREFEAVDSFWNDLAAIRDSPEVARVCAHLAAIRRQRRWRPHRSTWGVAATLILALAGVWLGWHRWSSGHYLTEVGQMRSVRLPDGSVATLNAGTEIRVRYSQGRRGVELIRGEANFQVAKDPSHPFLVAVGGGQVQALGTVFDIYKSTAKITVTLIEGTVAVTPSLQALSTSASDASVRSAIEAGAPKVIDDSVIVLTAGEQVSYATEPTGSASRAAARVSKVSNWQGRKLDFSNTPILVAIAEANRYSPEQIVLDAPQLKGARVSGIFEAGRSDLFAEGLRTYFHLQSVRASAHTIVLRLPSR